jgi:glucose/arabinose dehydrogenase
MTTRRDHEVPRIWVFVGIILGASAGCAKHPEPAHSEQPTTPPAAAPAIGASAAAGSATTAPAAVPAAPASPAAPRDLASATPDNPLRPDGDEAAVRNDIGLPVQRPLRLDTLKLPPGFKIEVYTAEVPNARSLVLGAKGTVFVSTRRDNRIYAVVDRNGDHKPEKVYTVAQGLETPNGLAYRNGSLYIGQIARLLRLDGIDKRLANPPKPVVVTDALPTETHHGWRYMRFGPDGMLYISIGAPCNICKREEPIFATIARMAPEGGPLEVFASGVRNSVGFDWHPETHELWFTDNGRDLLGNEIPPDELNRAPRAGMHFGFPYCHAGVIADPEFKDRSCKELEPPVQRLGPHTAALGMRFYTGAMFPPEYKNAVIIAEHGSWNREHKFGYRVMVVRFDGDKPVSYQPLVTGWLDDERDQAWGRPVDVEVLDDGSLLISDDWKGVLYRVTYQK